MGYLIAMGLAQALEYLEQLSFSSEQIQALQDTEIFDRAPEEFWQLLSGGFYRGCLGSTRRYGSFCQ